MTWLRRRALLLVALALAATSGCALVREGSTPAPAAPLEWVVFGDIPYSPAQVRQLRQIVGQVNADPGIQVVFHLGDIKGPGPCTSSYYRGIKEVFDQFEMPLVYTFGDNDWADCAKPVNGGYYPLERLAAARRIFFPTPGVTLGRPEQVASEAESGFPENVTLVRGPVSFGVFHSVGSRDGLGPRSGPLKPTTAQILEAEDRAANATRVIGEAFEAARANGLTAVVLVTQADLFPPEAEPGNPPPGYRSIVRTIATEAARFWGGEVYLVNGDTHIYDTDNPLAPDSRWLTTYGVDPVRNLTRVTVEGDENITGYLKFTAQADSRPSITWDKVPLESRAGSAP